MALITCPECGKEISDKALTCPHCGVPINMAMPIPVTFVRPKALANALLKLTVYVDGQNAGYLGNGDSFSVEMMTGRHIVELDCGNTHSENELILPDDAHGATVEVSAGGMFGGKISSVQTR